MSREANASDMEDLAIIASAFSNKFHLMMRNDGTVRFTFFEVINPDVPGAENVVAAITMTTAVVDKMRDMLCAMRPKEVKSEARPANFH